MSLQGSSILQFASHIHNHEIISIDIDGFVPDDKLLVRFPIGVDISNDLHVYIINIKFVRPHCQEIEFLRIVFQESNQKEPDSTPSHVSKEIELVIVFVENDLLDMIYFELFIEVDLFSIPYVCPDTILARCCHENILFSIRSKNFRLSFKRWIKDMNSLDFLCFEIHLKYLVRLDENNS